MRFSNFALAALSVFSVALAYPSGRDTNTAGSVLSESAQELFDFSMSINDNRWDDSYKYIWYLDNGPWSIRFTAWYIPGLLHRAQGNDIANANAALKNILAVQMNYDFESPWYGDFKLSPNEPNPTGPNGLYPEQIYATYDPNWREFVGSQLVQIVSEFEDLLEPSVITGIETALSYAAVGEMRRNGTAPDNLILAYSNPEYMRTLVVGWIGARLNNQTFIDFANTKGTQLFELFTANGSNTLGEYNCPNYYGEDVSALAANIKYGPPNATLTTNAKYILTEVWKDIAEHYNAYLGNMAGPYDRAYARDMPTRSAIVGQFWWGLFGYDKAPLPWKSNDDLHYDAAQGSAFALLISTVESVLSKETINKLITPFASDEERFLNKTIRDSLDTDVLRVATSWLSKDLMIGGEELAETVNRGKQFVPAIVHWAADPTHTPFPYGGWFSLYPTASTITATAGPNSLTITYPNATQEGSDSFQFMIGGIPPQWSLDGNSVDGFTNLPCISVSIDAPGLEVQPTNYWENVIYNHYYYNVTYVVPGNFTGIPRVSFALEYTC